MNGAIVLLIKLEKDAEKRVNTHFGHDDTFLYFYDYSYGTPYPQHSTDKIFILTFLFENSPVQPLTMVMLFVMLFVLFVQFLTRDLSVVLVVVHTF
jgi:hypothetical protein